MAYNTDLTDQQWCIISPLLPSNKGRGRPTELDLRLVLNAILYLVRTGCQWRNLPKDFFKWQSVYYYFRKWSKDGSWQAINETLRKMEREKRGRKPEPTGAIVDSQSVKTTEAGGERGYDGGKKVNGRKRHVVVDTVGNLLSVVVNAANSDDRTGAEDAFDKLSDDTIASLKKIWADGGYTGENFLNLVHETLQSALEIAHRPPNTKGFVVVPVRWVVERTLAWLGRYRRLSKDYEHCTKSSEGMIYVASITTMLKRLDTAH
jgi:putative transposase